MKEKVLIRVVRLCRRGSDCMSRVERIASRKIVKVTLCLHMENVTHAAKDDRVTRKLETCGFMAMCE